MDPGSGPSSGERWSVNMPALIGVVFVFLVGVVVWVVVSESGDDDLTAPSVTTANGDPAVTTTAAPVATTTTIPSDDTPAASTAPPTTAPATTAPPTTAPPTSAPPTTAPPTTAPPTNAPPTTSPTPPTTAPGAVDGAVPGDLGVPDRPMQRPPCDDSFIAVLASIVGDDASASGVGALLDQFGDANYLRTDQTCPSLRGDVDGEPIYVVYRGPFPFESDACAAREGGPAGAYARQLSDDLGPDHSVTCS